MRDILLRNTSYIWLQNTNEYHDTVNAVTQESFLMRLHIDTTISTYWLVQAILVRILVDALSL